MKDELWGNVNPHYGPVLCWVLGTMTKNPAPVERVMSNQKTLEFYKSLDEVKLSHKFGGQWVADMSPRWPTLVEAMLGEPGKKEGERMPGMSVLFFVDDGTLKARLQLRSRSLVAFVTLPATNEPLDALEIVLASGAAEWREDRRR